MALPVSELLPPSRFEGVAQEGNAPPAGDILPFDPPQAPRQGIGTERFFEILAERLPLYEHRKEQYDLTAAIAGTLQNKAHLAAQAPTGTGKSFAVGGAIIAAFLGTGKRAVIATANNSLLEQYASKDLPFLQSLFPQMRWARGKGKNNYACINKGEKLFGQQALFGKEEALKRLQRWYDGTTSGDREEINFDLSEADWAKVNADDTCTGKACPFYNECHYYRAKREMQRADIIVTNFDLVLLDALNPEIQIFPGYDALILDEAHQLEEKAISKLETSLTANRMAGFLQKAEKHYGVDDKGLLQKVSQASAALFSAYRGLLQDGQEKQSILPSHALIELSVNFKVAMKTLADAVWRHKTAEGTRERKAQEGLMASLDGAAHAVMSAVKNDERHISWVELTARGTDIKVVTAPFRVAHQLYQALFSNRGLSVVCLSATLGIKGKAPQFTATAAGLQPVALFDQFRQRVGMVTCGEFDCPSPFNYAKNCVLYLPKPPEGVTAPSSQGFANWHLDQIRQLVELSQGRALILTTSTAALKNINGYLSRNTQLQVKAQGDGLPNGQLIDWFKRTPQAVIVGTASFWEGISIEGDALKLVIIDKLPFAPHTDPIQQAREAWCKADPARKGRAFMDLQVYPAAIRLMQGFGRLIRTKSDTGVVALLDPRLTHARYKDVLLNSLPRAYRTTLLQDARLLEMLR